MDQITPEDKEVLRVLLVDDDSAFRWVLSRRLSKMGIPFDEADNGRAGYEFLQKNKYDLLITDIYMPEMDGFELVHAARNLYPDIQAIIMTASATLETAIKSVRYRAFDFLIKPVDTLALFDLTVSRALVHRRLEIENKRLFEELTRLSITDPLTGLFNRRRMEETLDLECGRAKAFGRDLSVVIMDLDNFKSLNDNFGHPEGDKVLCQLAQSIEAVKRPSDSAYRYGGDEFVLIFPETSSGQASEIVQELLTIFSDLKNPAYDISISSGVASWIMQFDMGSDLIKAADNALYRAKESEDKIFIFQNNRPTYG